MNRLVMVMVRVTGLILMGLPFVGPAAYAQDAKSQPPQSQTTKEAKQSSTDKIDGLIQKLGDEDYVVRDRAYEELLSVGDSAQPQLEKATKNEDPEIRWRAGRLLRALRSGEGGTNARPARPEKPRQLRRLDRGSEGESGERKGEAQEEPPPFPGLREWSGMDEGMRQHLQQLQEQMRQMQQEMDRLMRPGTPGAKRDFTSSNLQIQVNRDGEQLSLRSDDNGVEATVNSEKDGKKVTDTYKAKDLDDFKAKYPEVASKFGLDHMQLGMGLPFGSIAPMPRMPRLPTVPTTPRSQPPRLAPLAPAAPPQGPLLGVTVETPSEDLAGHLGLEAGEGLLVREVGPESLAEKLGIQKSDVILQVNGKRVGSPEDVRDALQGGKEGGAVTVEILRRGEKRTLSSAKR